MFIQPNRTVGLAFISLCLCLVVVVTAYGLARRGFFGSFHQWTAQAVIQMNPTAAESNGWF